MNVGIENCVFLPLHALSVLGVCECVSVCECLCVCVCVWVSLFSLCMCICMSMGRVPDTNKYYTTTKAYFRKDGRNDHS